MLYNHEFVYIFVGLVGQGNWLVERPIRAQDDTNTKRGTYARLGEKMEVT